MNTMLGRVSLAAAAVLALAGAAAARDAGRPIKGKAFAMPRYESATRVSGAPLPYDWPVADRYGPVSKPYFGRAY